MSKKKPSKGAQLIPLTQHKSGQWIKKLKVNGRWVIKYFGKDREKALAKWADERDYWLAGRTPPARQTRQVLTVEFACEAFAQSKKALLDAGQVGQRYFDEVLEFATLAKRELGPDLAVEDLTPSDFDRLLKAITSRWGVERTKKAVGVARSIFKYCFDCGFIDKPVRTGPNFKAPSRRLFRLHKQQRGSAMLEPSQLRQLIDAAGPELRAMILLGLNAGLLPTELLSLESRFISGKVLNFDRLKTGTPRRNMLWPETTKAIKALGQDGLLFPGWNRWRISDEYRELARSLGLHRDGVCFSGLRKIHKTIGETSGDSVAVSRSMGHTDNSIGDRYLEIFPDSRLQLVADAIRDWLFK